MPTDIEIIDYNAAYIKLECEEAIGYEISDDFSFYAPNYQYSPKFKKRHWDGKIRLFNRSSHLLYAGLLEKFLEWCREKNYTTDYEPPINALNPQALEEWNSSIVPSKEIRPYQHALVRRAIELQRATLLAPTASGKSLIAYLLARYYTLRTLIVVPTINLVNQMEKDFHDYGYCLEMERMNHEEPGSGIITDSMSVITVSTWQSLITKPPEYFEQFQMVIVDECHGAKAQSIIWIMQQLVNAPHRFGMTGTLDDIPINELTIEGLFGPIISEITTEELIEQGYASNINIVSIILEYPEQDRIKRSYQDEVSFLVNHEGRQRYVKNLAVTRTGSTFLLFRQIEHGKKLHELIEPVKGKNCRLVYGETEGDVRELIREEANVNNEMLTSASYGVFSTGANVPNLRNVIFGSPYKKKIKVLQSIGRALRKTSQKQTAYIYDIVDDLSADEPNYSVLHYFERLKIYNAEGFTYKQVKVKLE